MALIKNVDVVIPFTGDVAVANYWRLTEVSADRKNNKLKCCINLYLCKGSAQSGKRHIKNQYYMFPLLPGEANDNLIALCYAKIKALETGVLVGAVDG